MANRGAQKRRTAERKAKQRDRAKRTVLVEYARQLTGGGKFVEKWSDERLRDYILSKKPQLRRAVAAARGHEAQLAGIATAQAQFLRVLMGR